MVHVRAAEKGKKGIDLERLKAADANQDGKLTSDELGDKLWKRIAPSGPFTARKIPPCLSRELAT